MSDILIKNARIIDGTSNGKIFSGFIKIENDEIVEVAEREVNNSSFKIIDASGYYASPGFIDIHNKSDSHLTLLSQPSQESLIRQGVTTILGGNCGSSLAPLNPNIGLAAVQKWAQIYEINVNWSKFGEFFDFLDDLGLGVNFATLVGHNTLRRNLIRDEQRNLRKIELDKIKFVLEEALDDGVWGMSSGLEYAHGIHISNDEISELLDIIRQKSCLYAVHLKDEMGGIAQALDDIIGVLKFKEGARLEISHFKAVGDASSNSFENLLAKISDANSGANQIYFDIYPYEKGAKALYLFLPLSGRSSKNFLLLSLQNDEFRSRIMKEMGSPDRLDNLKKMIIAFSPSNKALQGKSLAEIADRQNKLVSEVVLDIILATNDKVVVFYDAQTKENILKGIQNPFSIISVDGPGFGNEKEIEGLPHPRSFGSFPRFLNWVLDKELNSGFSLEKAIHKITALPASQIGLKNRGVLKRGNKADIVIFSKKIKDTADFNNPKSYSEGIKAVIINGKIVLEDDKLIDSKAGRVLRKS